MKRYRFGDLETGIGMFPAMIEDADGGYVAIEDVRALIVGNVAFLMRLRQLQASLKWSRPYEEASERDLARDDVADELEAVLRSMPDQETLAAFVAHRVDSLTGPLEARTRYPDSVGSDSSMLEAGAVALARSLIAPRETPAPDPDAYSTRLLAQIEQLHQLNARADAGDALGAVQLVEASLGLLRSIVDPQAHPPGAQTLKAVP